MDHALTVRLPEQVYKAAKNMAARQGISMNQLVQVALANQATKSVKKRLNDAYDHLASEGTDAESAFSIQVEALLDE